MEKRIYTIKYGTQSEHYHNGHQIDVMCNPRDVETIACAIYNGHVKHQNGWCTVTDDTGYEYTIADCI